jgi:uncharacterized protein YjbI with pentapeptide repeats
MRGRLRRTPSVRGGGGGSVAEGFTCAVENEQHRSACKSLPKYSGSRYCVLHEPAGEKDKELFVSVKESKLARKDYDFGGTVFPEGTSDFEEFEFDADARFSGAIFLGAANFSAAKFSGEQTSFVGAHFSGEQTSFYSAQFDGDADFYEAQFNGHASFLMSRFSGYRASFARARFSGERTDFRQVRFDGKTAFSIAQFDGDGAFEGAQFNDDAVFGGAHFNGRITAFSRALFRGERTDFGGVYFNSETTDFYEAAFSGDETSFNGAVFDSSETGFGGATFSEEVTFRGARFESPQDFFLTVFNGKADFSYATFDISVRLRGKVPEVVDVNDGPLPRQGADLPGTQFVFNGIRLEQPDACLFQTVALRPSWLVNVVDVRKLRLINVSWREVTLDKELEVLAETDAPRELLARTCRELAANAEENRDYPLANDFYYWSMEVLRKEGLWHFGLIRTLYWALSGYGVKPGHAFWVLASICATFAVLFMLIGPATLRVFPISDVQQSVGNAAEAMVYSLGSMARLNPKPAPDNPGLFQLLVILEGLIGPLQIGLFLLAVRRKVMR